MPVLVKIAIRNLREHKSKTLIVGIIIAVGITVMLLGNSLMETSARGLQRSFIDNYTGHVMISAKAEGTISIFGVQGPQTGNEQIPRIPDYQRVYRYASSLPEVRRAVSQVSGYGVFSFEEKGNQFAILFGIEPDSYASMFPESITITAGRYLRAGEEGILVSESKIREIEEDIGAVLAPGDPVLVSGFGPTGFRIREIPIRGIFRFEQNVEGLSQISFIDVQSLRALLGMVVASAGRMDLSPEESQFLEVEDPEQDLFEDSLVVGSESQGGQLSEEALLDILGERSAESYAASIDSGAWHFILLKLEDERQVQPVIGKLNGWFAAQGIEAQAADWKTASGGFASLADTLKTVFNVLILIIAVVAIIIIMNTLVISVIERTGEIGTMRALGAQKRTVRRMFVFETLSISLVFGLIGVGFGALLIGILNLTGLPAPNPFFEILFGGKVLHPALPLSSLLYALGIIVAIGIVASLYPVAVALRIQPVAAIQAE
ncbi:MAG: ABC transporter permease [Spirochaetales bacterium]|nr:ABC transporter permease [Spirochaetales bacterium]